MSVPARLRHTKTNRCPICDGAEGDPRGKGKRCAGFTSADGDYVHCTSDEHAGSLDASNATPPTYAHRMHGSCKCGTSHGAARVSQIRQIVKTYDYRNAAGELLYQAVRYEPKDFRQRKPDGAGGWIHSLGDVERVLYRLPELLEDDGDRPVYIVEGEKDADALAAKGYTATTAAMGAGKWRFVATHARQVLAGRAVIIIADADTPGRDHARQVAASLDGAALSVSVLECPSPHKDVSDLLAAGGTLEQLVGLEGETDECEPHPPTGRAYLDEAPPPALVTLEEIIPDALVRAERRANGDEKPIPLPWPSLLPHFGGGLWSGVHFLNAGTGLGKTALGLQVALHGARAGFPAAYITLELEELQVALRLLGEEARVPWSKVYTGQAGPKYLESIRAVAPRLEGLPLHFVFSRPQGWPVSELGRVAEAMRAKYPEAKGPGSRPFLVVLDFLQIIGEETRDGRALDLRERIGRAAYFARDVAVRLGAVVLVVSSIGRAQYDTDRLITSAGLDFDADEHGAPIRRRLRNPDVLVGTAKESGEIEFSADSVSMLLKVSETFVEGQGVDVIFATAKGRATGASWSPLRFTGFSYREPEDRGGRIVSAWAEAQDRRAAEREEKAARKDQAKVAKITADAGAVAAYVLAHDGCSVREARLATVADNSRRWAPAVACLGPALLQAKHKGSTALTIDRTRLPDEVTRCL